MDTTIYFPQGSLLCADNTDEDNCLSLLLLGDPNCVPQTIGQCTTYDFFAPCNDETFPCLDPALENCINEYLEGEEFIDQPTVISLINTIVASHISELQAVVNDQNCCSKELLNVFGPNGSQTQTVNSLNLMEDCHIFQPGEEPDRNAAQLHFSFNENGLGNGDVVVNYYAGPDNGKGQIGCITHKAVKGRWVKIGFAEEETEKCCLYPENAKPTFPITYNSETSVWDIRGVEYKLPICRDEITVSPSSVTQYSAEDGQGIQVLSGVTTADISVINTTPGMLSGLITGDGLFVGNIDLWAGNNGTVNPSDVVDVCIQFNATGSGFGFGLIDASGNNTVSGGGENWIPSQSVTGPGSFVETANQTITLNTNSGLWEACYRLPGHVLNSNTIYPVFYGLGTAAITDVQVTATTQSESCTINDWQELADILTEVSPDDIVWFESCDNVCANLPINYNTEPLGPCGCNYKQ